MMEVQRITLTPRIDSETPGIDVCLEAFDDEGQYNYEGTVRTTSTGAELEWHWENEDPEELPPLHIRNTYGSAILGFIDGLCLAM